MTLVARHRLVPTIQRKTSGRIVVERTGFPSHIRMASLAFSTEPRIRMHRIDCSVVILLVAGNTCRGCSCKTLRMALGTVQPQVSTFEWKAGACVVIERRGVPIDFIVTHFAIGWKMGGCMCRIGGGIVIFEVAGHASS